MNKCMLDTNVFNYLLDGYIEMTALPKDVEFVATHVQHDELNAAPDSARRSKLLETFHHIAAVTMPTGSGVWDITRWDDEKWGDGVIYKELLAMLEMHKTRKSNVRDALMAEAALINKWLFVTADEMLADAITKHAPTSVFLFRRRDLKS